MVWLVGCTTCRGTGCGWWSSSSLGMALPLCPHPVGGWTWLHASATDNGGGWLVQRRPYVVDLGGSDRRDKLQSIPPGEVFVQITAGRDLLQLQFETSPSCRLAGERMLAVQRMTARTSMEEHVQLQEGRAVAGSVKEGRSDIFEGGM